MAQKEVALHEAKRDGGESKLLEEDGTAWPALLSQCLISGLLRRGMEQHVPDILL